MKKPYIALTFLIPASCFSTESDVQQRLNMTPEQINYMNQDIASKGLPIPGGGIKVVPLSKIVLSPNQKTMFKNEQADVYKYGYINKSHPDINILLNFKVAAKKSFSVTKKNSELKKTFAELDLAWEVTSLPVPGVEMLGIAPAETYIKEKGWVAYIAFFEKKDIGICHYIENNLKYSLGSAQFVEEDITRDVNGKVTKTAIIGQPGHGFVYDVNWYDDGFFHEMRCANAEFDKGKINLMIELAKTIDINS